MKILLENVMLPDIDNIEVTADDFILADYLNVRDAIPDAKAIIAQSKLSGPLRNTVEELKKLFIFMIYCMLEGADSTAKEVWKGFLKKCDSLSYVHVKRDEDRKVAINAGENIKYILSDISILNKLTALSKQAATIEKGQQAESELRAKEAKATNANITVDNNGNMPYYRIVMRDTRYTPPAPCYIIFGKKNGNTYKMSTEGSPRRKGNYDEPAFETAQQADAFIRKAIVDMQTARPMGDNIYTITNKPFADAKIPKDLANYNGYPYWEAYTDLSCYKIVDTDCGPCYINKKCKLAESIKGNKSKYNFTDALLEDTEEMPSANAVAKHTTLNPKLWTADEVLKPEVEEKIKQIVDVFLAGLAEDEIKINVRDILIIGSNASYNYTPYSDLDLHIIVDTGSLECPDNLYSKLYSAYRSLFNKRLDIDFYGVPVELYVEDEGTPRVSNGVYSVLNREWLQEPKYVNIPDMDMDIFNAELSKWEDRYRQVLNDAVSELEEYYEPDLDAAEDIKTQQIKEIDAYIEDLYNLRKIGLPLTGEYGLENVIFKTIRNKGYLDKLKDLKNELLGKELSLEEKIKNMVNNELKDIPEGLDMLTNKQITEYRVKIAQLAHTQPLINAYGKFTISNVRENDADYICRILKAQDFIVNVNKTPGRFDFKAMATTGMPSRMYSITGQIKI